MKCLRIDNGKGDFSLNGTDFSPIDKINKEDVLLLLNIALDPDQDLEMDEYDSKLFTNPAHRVIYENLHNKFTDLKSSKVQFVNDVNELYQDVLAKYKPRDVDSDDEEQEDSIATENPN